MVMFTNLLKNKIFVYTGLVFTVLALYVGLQSYSYRSESAVAKSLESARHYVDSLDGEIEDFTNPDVSQPDMPASPTENGGQVLGAKEEPKEVVQKRTGPDRLIIDKLGINAYVQHVGLARSGNMGVPTNFKDVGWYKLGPKPGDPGNAVFAGHVDNALGLPGVFSKLSTLSVGDVITIKNGDGTVKKFRVSSKETISYNSTDTSKIFTRTGQSRLVLITCSGTWLRGERSYTERLIVYADLIK